MEKKTIDTIIGLGLFGVPFVCAGIVIGVKINEKINDKYSDVTHQIWKNTAEILKDQLYKSWDRERELRKELESK